MLSKGWKFYPQMDADGRRFSRGWENAFQGLEGGRKKAQKTKTKNRHILPVSAKLKDGAIAGRLKNSRS